MHTSSPGAQKDPNLRVKYGVTDSGELTTIMIRNVPNEYTQDMFIEEIVDFFGAPSVCDFVHLPWDSENSTNIGYGFVNFVSEELAQMAIEHFTNYAFCKHGKRKVGKVSLAHIQGFENNLRHLRDRAIVQWSHPCAPVVFRNGQKMDLKSIFKELDARPAGGSVPGRVRAPLSAPVAPLSGNRCLQPQGWHAILNDPMNRGAFAGYSVADINAWSQLRPGSVAEAAPSGAECAAPSSQGGPPQLAPPQGPPLSQQGPALAGPTNAMAQLGAAPAASPSSFMAQPLLVRATRATDGALELQVENSQADAFHRFYQRFGGPEVRV